MRLVTFDRSGRRRLGALVGGSVVDLPDAVGHPAFPVTMEGLVARNGGSTLAAARDAVAVADAVERFTVTHARLLVPFLPASPRRPLFGPDALLPWPAGQPYLDHRPELACIVGRRVHRATPRQAASAIFGYTLMLTWTSTSPRRRAIARALGPLIMTADDEEPAGTLVSKVNGETVAELPMEDVRRTFAEVISGRSMTANGVRPGTVLASPLGRRSGGVGIPLEPETVVQVHADGLGTLTNRLDAVATRLVAVSR